MTETFRVGVDGVAAESVAAELDVFHRRSVSVPKVQIKWMLVFCRSVKVVTRLASTPDAWVDQYRLICGSSSRSGMVVDSRIVERKQQVDGVVLMPSRAMKHRAEHIVHLPIMVGSYMQPSTVYTYSYLLGSYRECSTHNIEDIIQRVRNL